jgi:hypothetical protein
VLDFDTCSPIYHVRSHMSFSMLFCKFYICPSFFLTLSLPIQQQQEASCGHSSLLTCRGIDLAPPPVREHRPPEKPALMPTGTTSATSGPGRSPRAARRRGCDGGAPASSSPTMASSPCDDLLVPQFLQSSPWVIPCSSNFVHHLLGEDSCSHAWRQSLWRGKLRHAGQSKIWRGGHVIVANMTSFAICLS